MGCWILNQMLLADAYGSWKAAAAGVRAHARGSVLGNRDGETRSVRSRMCGGKCGNPYTALCLAQADSTVERRYLCYILSSVFMAL